MKGATILKNFDLDSIRKARARKAASGGINLVDAINQISPEIGKLKVGETAQLPIQGGKANLRKFVMSITAKLNNLTPKGGDWEGRTFKVVSDSEEYVYVQRGEDDKNPAERKRRGGGGRKASETPAEAGETVAKGGTVKAESGALVEEHA